MTGLLWNQIPFVTAPQQDDDLLLVNSAEQSRRIKQKDLIYSQLAELSWVVSSTQNQGIGTANVWGNILYNQLTGPDWISLNADGSWSLDAGLYLLDLSFQVCLVRRIGYRIFDNVNTLFYRSSYLGTTDIYHYDLRARKRLSLPEQKTLSLQVNVEAPQVNAFFYPVSALSGLSPTIAQGFIWKLG